MEPSRAAYDLIMRLEVFSNKAYKCRAGVLTIGYGHTGDVKATDVITKSKALDLLAQDVMRYTMFRVYDCDLDPEKIPE